MAHSWFAAGYTKTWFKCDVMHFSRGKRPAEEIVCVCVRECCTEPWSLFTSPLYVSFPVCRRASSNDLPPLCRAPSAWPWAEAIWCLFVPVTSAPTGTRNYFSSFYWAPEWEPMCLWILLYVGVWWVREMVRRTLACTRIVAVEWKLQDDQEGLVKADTDIFG